MSSLIGSISISEITNNLIEEQGRDSYSPGYIEVSSRVTRLTRDLSTILTEECSFFSEERYFFYQLFAENNDREYTHMEGKAFSADSPLRIRLEILMGLLGISRVTDFSLFYENSEESIDRNDSIIFQIPNSNGSFYYYKITKSPSSDGVSREIMVPTGKEVGNTIILYRF